MDQELSQVVIKRSKLRNVYLKHRSEESRIAYKKERNFCVTLRRKKKADYFNDLHLNFNISNYFVNNP